MKFIRIVAIILILAVVGVLINRLMMHSMNSPPGHDKERKKPVMAAQLHSAIINNTPQNPSGIIRPWFATINGRVQPEFDLGLEDRSSDPVSGHRHMQAIKHGAIGKLTLIIVDNHGKPVPKASVRGGFYMNEGDGSAISSMTDEAGIVELQGKSTSDLNVRIEKKGFYKTSIQYLFHKSGYNCVENDRWLPWNPFLEIKLKAIVNPIVMHVSTGRSSHHEVPVLSTLIGFDLFKNDWLAPYGKGRYADLFMTYDWDGRKHRNYSGATLTFIFTDQHSGAYIVKNDMYSIFKSPYYADSQADYQTEVKFEYIRKRDGQDCIDTRLSLEDCLVMRIRTTTDVDGNLTSAYYAKMYGPLHFGYGKKETGSINVPFYLNTTPNDTNLEADTSGNLLNEVRQNFPP